MRPQHWVKGKSGRRVSGRHPARRDHPRREFELLRPGARDRRQLPANWRNGKAAITGDFVDGDSEVNPVIRALRTNGIEVMALHSHLLDEQPRLFFMHFWANDDMVKLAKGVRAALDKMANAEAVGRGSEMK